MNTDQLFITYQVKGRDCRSDFGSRLSLIHWLNERPQIWKDLKIYRCELGRGVKEIGLEEVFGTFRIELSVSYRGLPG
jgi:hypothetical protein